jgi:hypothetical protein
LTQISQASGELLRGFHAAGFSFYLIGVQLDYASEPIGLIEIVSMESPAIEKLD